MKRRLSRRITTFLHTCCGTNMIEAAIITPLLLVLTFAIVDFSSMFYVYLALENGVSQATRFAVTGGTKTDPNNPSAMLSRQDSIKLVMRQATPTLTLADSSFSFSHITGSSWTTGLGGPGEVGKVTVTYTWAVMTPLIRPFFPGGQIQFTVSSAMKNESYQ